MRKQRLTGVDLLRGVAVYAVAVLHSGDAIPATTGWAGKLIEFSAFAVPFFLAASFYFAVDKLYNNGVQTSLKSRLTRLLIPYCFWSIVYLIYKVIKYSIADKTDALVKIFQDPVNLVFFGGAAFHLYFLPLLFLGTVLLRFANLLVVKQIKPKVLILLFIVSISIYELVLASGNAFRIGSGVAFQGLLESAWLNENLVLRLLLVGFAWAIRCLPYILLAMLLTHPAIEKKSFLRFDGKSTLILFIAFLVINISGGELLPEAMREILRGYISLLFSISLSKILKENHFINNIGLCSFGIYLIHLMAIETFKIIANKIYPDMVSQVSILTLLTFSIVGFITSWAATAFLIKKKAVAKLMFGT